MKQIALDVKDKLKWDKSSLLETNIYIKIYLDSLNSHLSLSEKQSLFMISKYFTDGAAEVGRSNLQLANYYFEKGEKYLNQVSKENETLGRVMDNVYHRSKSFYYHKTKDFQSAVMLIEKTLENNLYLEKNGFDFLIFDRVQQYYNLARVYFGMNNADYAFSILTHSCCFLIEQKSVYLTSLNENYLIDFTTDTIRLRFSLLYQFICETTEQLQRVENKDGFIAGSFTFYEEIINSAARFVILCPEDEILKKWLILLSLFYKKKYEKFKREANMFFTKNDNFFDGRLKKITDYFLRLT